MLNELQLKSEQLVPEEYKEGDRNKGRAEEEKDDEEEEEMINTRAKKRGG